MDQQKIIEKFKISNPGFFNKSGFSFVEGVALPLQEDFKTTFPNFSTLLAKATVLNVTYEKDGYQLLAWQDAMSGEPFGILLRHDPGPYHLPFIREHVLLLENVGGIFEYYNLRNEHVINLNQNFMFSATYCWQGLPPDVRVFYQEKCARYGFTPIDSQHLIGFALEANHNAVYYDPQTSRVLMWAHDHDFSHITILENHPELTFHKINGVETFTDFVELMARQLLASSI